MFIGHFGAGFASKAIDRNISLGTLFLASQFIDLLWPIFLLLGIESVKVDPGNTSVTPLNFTFYPISHSMLSVIVWGILFGTIYYFIKKNLIGSILLGGLVFSHWLLDFLTHRPDLQLFPWSSYKVGLGLWNSLSGTIIVESFIFITGVYIFYNYAKPSTKQKRILLFSLVIILAIIYAMNLAGPPPPSEKPLAFVGLAQWLLIAWAYWADKS